MTNDRYLRWLTKQVGFDNEYASLCEVLDAKEFVWVVPNDDNRVSDALSVRREYEQDKETDIHSRFVSVLEIIVALSRRLEWERRQVEAPEWAEILLQNLKLSDYKGTAAAFGTRTLASIDRKLEMLIWRTYTASGKGSFFPLEHPEIIPPQWQDMRYEEIWFQMHRWLQEQYEKGYWPI